MKKLFLACLFMLVFANKIICQTVPQPDEVKNSGTNIKTPETSNFVRYGNIPLSEFTGEISHQIPLWTGKVNNSSIDISLNYRSMGFMPSKRPGMVGHNWFLNCGGMISRKINGKPDDRIGGQNAEEGDGYAEHGFLVGVRRNKYKNNDVFNLEPSTGAPTTGLTAGEWLLSPNGDRYEGEPDEFNFNFMGYSGKFMIGNDGLPRVISDSPNHFKIDLSLLTEQNYALCSPTISTIIITDDQGTIYEFGGTLSSMEYNTEYHGTGVGNKKVITAWYLRKITYLNNDVVDFNYRELLPAIDSGFCYDNRNVSNQDLISMDLSFNEDKRAEGGSGCVPGLFGFLQCSAGYQVLVPDYPYNVQITKKVILSSINAPNFTIRFDYTRQDENFYRVPNFFNYKDIKLSQITVSSKIGGKVKNINFMYAFLGNSTHKRMFLKGLSINNNPVKLTLVDDIKEFPLSEAENYYFEYYKTDNLSFPETKGLDYWNFWNGLDNQKSLIPDMEANYDTGALIYTGNQREPNTGLCDVGLLKKIIYPTKGFSEFIYEPHTYSKRLERLPESKFLPVLNPIKGIAGGARIKEIINFDGIKNTEYKKYYYSRDYVPGVNNLESSGVLLSWPRYMFFWRREGPLPSNTQILRNTSINTNLIEDAYITYGEVTEEIVNKGYTIKKFSDYLTNPDVNNYNLIQISGTDAHTVIPMDLRINYVGLFYNNLANERGKLISKKSYDNLNVLKEEEAYIYNNSSTKFDDYIAKTHNTYIFAQSTKSYIYPNYLTKKILKTYLKDNIIVNTEEYEYGKTALYRDDLLNDYILRKSKIINSLNETIETTHKYPWDVYATGSNMYNHFKNSNIVRPINQVSYKNTNKINETFTEYIKDNTTNNLLLPSKNYQAKFPNSLTLIPEVGNLEKKITYNGYDSSGNLTQFTPENGVPVSIIWGYNNTQPIAKLENIAYGTIPVATIADLQAKSDADTDDCSTATCKEEILRTALNALRNSFPLAQITTYTYKPLIGVTSITDPKGDKQTYTYDGLGRLLYVKDKDGKILSQNQYHYKN